MSELNYVIDAMIEAAGALRVVETEGNSVNSIVAKLNFAISKAKALADDGQPSATGATQETDEKLKEDLGELVDDFLSRHSNPSNVVPLAPISQADFGKADQSPPTSPLIDADASRRDFLGF